jgi:SOUL heme-binding protein
VARHFGRSAFQRYGRIALKTRMAHLAIEIDIETGKSQADENCYRLLIEYLSGSNASSRPIALKASMQQIDEDEWQLTEKSVSKVQPEPTAVRFELSAARTLGWLPEPTDPRVHLRSVALSRSATIWFAGRPSAERIASQSEQLRNFISLNNLLPASGFQEEKLRTTRRGPFGMLTELSLPISVWTSGRAIRSVSASQRGYQLPPMRLDPAP